MGVRANDCDEHQDNPNLQWVKSCGHTLTVAALHVLGTDEFMYYSFLFLKLLKTFIHLIMNTRHIHGYVKLKYHNYGFVIVNVI